MVFGRIETQSGLSSEGQPALYVQNVTYVSLVPAWCSGSRLQNGSGSGENAGRTLVRDFLLGLKPVLNVGTTKVSAVEDP